MCSELFVQQVLAMSGSPMGKGSSGSGGKDDKYSKRIRDKAGAAKFILEQFYENILVQHHEREQR